MHLQNIVLCAAVTACCDFNDVTPENHAWYANLHDVNSAQMHELNDVHTNEKIEEKTKKEKKDKKEKETECRVSTCKNDRCKWTALCRTHLSNYRSCIRKPELLNNPSRRKLFFEAKAYYDFQKTKPPKCTKCGETDKKKFTFRKKRNRWNSWCKRCHSMCHEHSTPGKTYWINACEECKLAGKNPPLLCHANNICTTRINPKHAIYGSVCERCFVEKNPDHVITIYRKEKEHAFHEVLKSMSPNITIYRDFRVHVNRPDGETGYKLVDFRIETPHLIIDTEFDEEQHKAIRYGTPQERMRSDLIYQTSLSSGKQYIMLRFNPDKFKAKNGDKIRSCFIQRPGVKPYISDKAQWELRTSYFKSRLEECMQLDPENSELFPHIEHMFYDDFDTSTLTFDASSHVRKRKRA